MASRAESVRVMLKGAGAGGGPSPRMEVPGWASAATAIDTVTTMATTSRRATRTRILDFPKTRKIAAFEIPIQRNVVSGRDLRGATCARRP
jgi:hypothetical protein